MVELILALLASAAAARLLARAAAALGLPPALVSVATALL